MENLYPPNVLVYGGFAFLFSVWKKSIIQKEDQKRMYRNDEQSSTWMHKRQNNVCHHTFIATTIDYTVSFSWKKRELDE